jgi:hypothetical protein
MTYNGSGPDFYLPLVRAVNDASARQVIAAMVEQWTLDRIAALRWQSVAIGLACKSAHSAKHLPALLRQHGLLEGEP